MTTAMTAFPQQHAGTPVGTPDIDNLAINTIRTLAMDAVQAADSGHPGTPMALAPVAYALWQDILRYDPADPTDATIDTWFRLWGFPLIFLGVGLVEIGVGIGFLAVARRVAA